MIAKIHDARNTFLRLRLGMFIHFGLYSQGREHEWHMYNHKMSLAEYKARFMESFNPDPAGMEQWVRTAKEMGAKYIVCTSKHCDGFCLWDTSVKHGIDSDYHVRNTKFYKEHEKGVLDFLFEAGRKHDIKIGLYHAVIDWSWTKKKKRRPPEHTFKKARKIAAFLENMNARLEELMDLYPDLFLFWFDGHVFYKNGYERLNLGKTYDMLHGLKEDILVGFNSATTSNLRNMPKADFLIFENMAHKGESNGAPWPRDDPVQLPGEVCLTINNHWGYNEADKEYKDPGSIVDLVLENTNRRSNTLLNFGPKPDGFIADDQVELAKAIGGLLREKMEEK